MASTKRDGVRYFNCCICEDIFEGYGNNPYPITNEDGNLFWDEEECCDSCNNTKVMPERFKQMGLV
jgi:hypothetical protein